MLISNVIYVSDYLKVIINITCIVLVISCITFVKFYQLEYRKYYFSKHGVEYVSLFQKFINFFKNF